MGQFNKKLENLKFEIANEEVQFRHEKKKEEVETNVLKNIKSDNDQLNNDLWQKQFNLELDYKHMRRVMDEDEDDQNQKRKNIQYQIKDLTNEL